jgi:hypothetical protein
MRYRVRSRLARWLAGRSAGDFQLYTRIHGRDVELDATHLPTGQRFIARADEFDVAAAGLARLIDDTFGRSQARLSGPASAMQRTWERAGQALRKAIRAAWVERGASPAR